MSVQNDQAIWVRCDTLLTPRERRADCVLHIEKGRICDLLSLPDATAIPSSRWIHEPNAIVAPGFIDLHVHGARGRDLMDGSRESILAVAESLAVHGTTSFLATTLSAPDADTEIALRGFRAHCDSVGEGAKPLGLHMEGPFLNPVRRGTHDAAYLKPADIRSFRRFLEIADGRIRKMTVAPEWDEGFRLIREATSHGIRVSLGHSDATFEQARAAVEAGATQATHTFNAMRPFHQREPGILGLVLTDPRVLAEVIVDGIHVHPAAIRLLWRMKGPERVLLVSDALSALDMPDGRHPLGDKIVHVANGACRDDSGILAGSTLTLDRAVRNLVQWLGVPLEEALEAAGATPARSLGLGCRKGLIAPGADADLVFLDANLEVIQSMVAGRLVYRRSRSAD